MAITFEEVTGEIQHEPQAAGSGSAAAPTPAPAEDLAAQLDRELRLRAERAARLSAE